MAVATSFDVSAIENYAKKNVNKIMGLVAGGLKATSQITVYEDIREETGLTTFKAGNLGQPYRDDFEPKEDAFSFGYRTLVPKLGKVDLQIVPLHFYKTWLVVLRRAGVKPYDLPYEQFFMDQIALKWADEINKQSVYHGVYNAAGTSTTDIQTGFKKIIADEIAASNLDNVVATGAISESNAIAKLEAMAESLPIDYREIPLKMYLPYGIYDKYVKNYRATFGDLAWNVSMAKKTLDNFENIEFERASWMTTSGRVILTPKENLVMGTDVLSDLNDITVIRDVRLLKIAMQCNLSYQIADLESIWVNDQV